MERKHNREQSKKQRDLLIAPYADKIYVYWEWMYYAKDGGAGPNLLMVCQLR